ncbi:hypothetical protein GCM10022252_74080 [Streptosporangium oxazolinicum]|uniref:Uncharacterized protein n=1 Tax=Streptosporangium oxazolinicum TaxID=909287 RepID=A0ABP8BJT2_9ACTN
MFTQRLGGRGERVQVPSGEHLALDREQHRRQPPGAAPGTVSGGERGRQLVGVGVLAQRECRATEDHQHLVGGTAPPPHRREGAEADRGAVGVGAEHQACPPGGGQVLDGRSQRGGGTQDHGELAGLVGRRHQEQTLAGLGHPADLAVEGQVQAAGEGERPR